MSPNRGPEPGDADDADIDESRAAAEPLARLLRDLRTSRRGLSQREADRRLQVHGPNVLQRKGGHRLWREFLRQFSHPLALLLFVAAALAAVAGIVAVAIAILVVIVVNAVFAFLQELQAERAVEALADYLPQHARVLRDGHQVVIDSSELVPGDIMVLEEGARISADVRLLSGTVEVDTSTLTGESMSVERSAGRADLSADLLSAPDLVFSGTSCTGGDAHGVVIATGMRTELGRIASLSERVETEESPLEAQVRKVAWVIAAVAVTVGLAFLPIAVFIAGLNVNDAVVFAVGLIAGNVPEGLLPVITLALAVGVADLARRGAAVKRLSAVETLGSTDVICTDKTGTLTQNRMEVVRAWTSAGEHPGPTSGGERPGAAVTTGAPSDPVRLLAEAMVACNNAQPEADALVGDPTEVALLEAAKELGQPLDEAARERGRRREFHFDPTLKLMSTVDQADRGLVVHTKGAPEALLPLCSTIVEADGSRSPLDGPRRQALDAVVDGYARAGLRVLALGIRDDLVGEVQSWLRDVVEADLAFLGFVAMVDPPRPEVADAVARCHTAGIRVIVVSGDHPLTATAVASQVGIDQHVVRTGAQLDAMTESELDELLAGEDEIVFARTSPEAKLRIADALRALGHIVAMTGDGVNDAPALRRADIGVAMGRSGTDVAREAATMILTDDNFATIVTAVESGRQVYDNIRKFILYIFAHATPEVVPFLVYALGGGRIPLPLPILLILAFDVGTETLPALALGREPAEPGIMERPPRKRSDGVITRSMLWRAWCFLGAIAAALGMLAYFWVLTSGGWHPGDPVGEGTPLHHVYLQATTMTFFALVMGQIGTAFASRTDRVSLFTAGVFSNRLLLWGIAFELALTAAIVYFPPLQSLLSTAALTPQMVAFTLPFPFIVWGADELRRWVIRRRT